REVGGVAREGGDRRRARDGGAGGGRGGGGDAGVAGHDGGVPSYRGGGARDVRCARGGAVSRGGRDGLAELLPGVAKRVPVRADRGGGRRAVTDPWDERAHWRGQLSRGCRV